MSRAATAPELAKFADVNASDVYAIIAQPAVVFAARVNQAAVNYDRLVQLTFDGVTTGAYTDILPGMTVLVGSAAGLSDKGIGYARKAAGAATLYLGETSRINAADNDYITVLRDFGIWAKHPRVMSNGTIYVNYAEAYVAQLGTQKSAITAGGDRVLELTGATVAATYALSGCASYVTTCAGATVTNGTTDHPTVTANAAGEYLVKIVGTAANSTVTTTYRNIYVWDAAHPPVNVVLSNDSGDESGWTATIDMYESQSAIRERAKVVIFAKDYYGGTLGSIGSLTGCENIVTTGWIDGKSLVFDEVKGSITFDIKPAYYWMDQEQATTEVTLTKATAATDWKTIVTLTADAMIWHLLENYSTALNCMDFIPLGSTIQAATLTAPVGSLWAQIKSITDKVSATPYVNQYGQLSVYMDSPLLAAGDRPDAIMTLTADDFENISADIIQVEPNAQLLVTGQLVTGKTIASIGGGHIMDPRATAGSNIDGLIASSQSQLNYLAGALFAKENCPYHFSITNLRGNNRLIEPGNRLGLTLTGSDNLQGLAYSGYIVVRSITRGHNPETGAWQIDLEADAETTADRYCTGDISVTDDPTIPEIIIPFPNTPIPIPGIPPTPPYPAPEIPDPSGCTSTAPATAYALTPQRTWIDGIAGDTNSTIAWKACTIRPASYDNGPTVITFDLTNQGLAYSHLHVDAINGAEEVLASATVSYTGTDPLWHMTATFSEASALSVAGFKFWLDEGLDSTDGPAITFDSVTWEDYHGYGTQNYLDGSQVTASMVMLSFSSSIHDISILFGEQVNQKIGFINTSGSTITKLHYAGNIHIESDGQAGYAVGALDWVWYAAGSNDATFWGDVDVTLPNGDGTNHQVADGSWWTELSTSLFYGRLYVSTEPILRRSAAFGDMGLYNVCPAE